MSDEKLKINILGNDLPTIIEFREGAAMPLREPVKLDIKGNIEAVRYFLEKRHQCIEPQKCHILVTRRKNDMNLKLVIDETSHYQGTVVGILQFDEDFLEFGINKGKRYSLRDLSDFIKMHRYCFADQSVAMKLVAELRNFKAKVNKDIEKISDNRGNRNELMNQVVDSNIPESFTLGMPIFKGGIQYSFAVEINIIVRDADMECTLESVEANDLIMMVRDKVFASELEEIMKLSPEIVQIEV